VQELVVPNYINGVKVNGLLGAGWAQGVISPSANIKSVIISPGITSIGDYTFCCSSLIEDITIPDTVTSFGEYALCNMFALKSLYIPSSVTSIGFDCFSGWGNVKALKLHQIILLSNVLMEYYLIYRVQN
jgi:hypothetical protein